MFSFILFIGSFFLYFSELKMRAVDYIKLYYDEAGVACGNNEGVASGAVAASTRARRIYILHHVRLTIFDALLYVLFENFNETRCGIIFGIYLQ